MFIRPHLHQFGLHLILLLSHLQKSFVWMRLDDHSLVLMEFARLMNF